MRSAHSKRRGEAERAEDEFLYCTTGILAHMFDGRRLFLWVLNVFAEVRETTLIRFASVIFEEGESQTQHQRICAFF